MKALEIYEQDIIDREAGNALPRQQYYAALRDALSRELMHQGYCEWLEQVLLDIREGRLSRIYVLDYAALMECHSMIVLGREMRDASEFVPHLHLRGAKAAWAALEKPGSFLMPVTRDMAEKFKQLRAVSRLLVDARDDAVLPQADDAAQREIEQVHTLNKMLDERCKALQAERDELQNRLRLLEEGVITEQVRYAIEARRLQEEEALRQTYEAQREAAREAYRTELAGALSAARDGQEEAARETAVLRSEAAQDYAAVRRDMGDDLRQLVQTLQTRISAWESALDRSECRMLASCYAALHALWAGDMQQLLLQAQCAGTPPAVMASLADLSAGLRDRLNQLEQAMVRLGLTILRPGEGDLYDPALHIPAGTAHVPPQARIARCVTPGVMVPGTQEALLRAQVELA